MKKIVTSALLLFFVSFSYSSFANYGHGAIPVNHEKISAQVSPVKISFKQQLKEIEKITGRKLTLKEKLALRIQRLYGPYVKTCNGKPITRHKQDLFYP